MSSPDWEPLTGPDSTGGQALAAAERAQADVLTLAAQLEALEERLASALRRVDALEAVVRRVRRAIQE